MAAPVKREKRNTSNYILRVSSTIHKRLICKYSNTSESFLITSTSFLLQTLFIFHFFTFSLFTFQHFSFFNARHQVTKSPNFTRRNVQVSSRQPCLSTKCPHQEIRRNYGILHSVKLALISHFSRLLILVLLIIYNKINELQEGETRLNERGL